MSFYHIINDLEKIVLTHLRRILHQNNKKLQFCSERVSIHPCTWQLARSCRRDAYFLKILIEANQLAQRGIPEIPAREWPQKLIIISGIYLLKPLPPPGSLENWYYFYGTSYSIMYHHRLEEWFQQKVTFHIMRKLVWKLLSNGDGKFITAHEIRSS